MNTPVVWFSIDITNRFLPLIRKCMDAYMAMKLADEMNIKYEEEFEHPFRDIGFRVPSDKLEAFHLGLHEEDIKPGTTDVFTKRDEEIMAGLASTLGVEFEMIGV